MPDIRDELSGTMSHEDPVRRAQIQMLKPLPKRFYKEVSIAVAEGDTHSVLLDGRTVRTPAKQPLAVPTRKLADMLAAEWEAQTEVIDPARMPITRLVNTALDGVAKTSAPSLTTSCALPEPTCSAIAPTARKGWSRARTRSGIRCSTGRSRRSAPASSSPKA